MYCKISRFNKFVRISPVTSLLLETHETNKDHFTLYKMISAACFNDLNSKDSITTWIPKEEYHTLSKYTETQNGPNATVDSNDTTWFPPSNL